jgi:hypothetical protein
MKSQWKNVVGNLLTEMDEITAARVELVTFMKHLVDELLIDQ